GKLGTHPERYVAARRNLQVIDRNLMPCLHERPGDPMCLVAIRRVETDEEFLSHRRELALAVPRSWHARRYARRQRVCTLLRHRHAVNWHRNWHRTAREL